MAGATKLLTSGGGGVTLQPASSIASDVVVQVPSVACTLVGGANGIAPEASGGTGTTTGYYGFKNRIINGNMAIDQRNAGASVTPTTSGYTLDRWQYNCTQASKMSIQQNAGSVTPPVGFVNYLGITTASAYSVAAGDVFSLAHRIEGFNFADFNWGTANASTVTLSFWVRSSLTGTFGGSFRNSAANRSYPFTYTISSANTWEQKSVTILGDATGAWLTTNGTGVTIFFGLGAGSTYSGTAGSWAATDYNTATGATSVVGTNGATFYITGVQLEKGSAATSFDYRPYGTELALCQRYYESSFDIGTAPANGLTAVDGGGCTPYTTAAARTPAIYFKCQKRAVPTISYYGGTQSVTNGQWAYYNGSWATMTSTATGTVTTHAFYVELTRSASFTALQSLLIQGNWAASAEL